MLKVAVLFAAAAVALAFFAPQLLLEWQAPQPPQAAAARGRVGRPRPIAARARRTARRKERSPPTPAGNIRSTC